MSKRISDTYRVAMYLRLSQDDEKYDKDFKVESNSISNQRLQIQDYIDKNEEMELAGEYVDDGYSGINFERPAFKEMMEDVITGSINCIVVKDLSRFGRDYIDSGRYLQRVFPSLDIRFIALNDNYDSFTASETEKNLVIPFKNFINDNYCRDTSAKVRSVCKVKRKQGQFISNYAPYGYEKDEEDKHKIVIDKEVEYVVRKIFSMKLEGYSSYSIAKHLNDNGIPSPMEHKKAKGIRYKTGFSTKAVAKWDTPAVNRILTNEVYIGTLQQGKREKINYKLDKVVSKDRSDWIEIEDNHEAIIDPHDFEIVQKLLKCDIKAKTVGEKADLFSGLLFCKDCNAQMTKKKVNCIVVKDLSRFGRNYTELGNFIEKIFPFLGVRFVAVNDNLDTFHMDDPNKSLEVILKNIVNENLCNGYFKESIKLSSDEDQTRRIHLWSSSLWICGTKG